MIDETDSNAALEEESLLDIAIVPSLLPMEYYDDTILRRRFGHFSVQSVMMVADQQLTGLNPKDEHVIYPVAYKKIHSRFVYNMQLAHK